MWWVRVWRLRAQHLEPSKTVGEAAFKWRLNQSFDWPTQMAIPLQMDKKFPKTVGRCNEALGFRIGAKHIEGVDLES